MLYQYEASHQNLPKHREIHERYMNLRASLQNHIPLFSDTIAPSKALRHPHCFFLPCEYEQEPVHQKSYQILLFRLVELLHLVSLLKSFRRCRMLLLSRFVLVTILLNSQFHWGSIWLFCFHKPDFLWFQYYLPFFYRDLEQPVIWHPFHCLAEKH